MNAAPPKAAVYGVALNFKASLEALGDDLYRDPYKQPPEAPILYLKPANCWRGPGDRISVPEGVDRLKMGGTLGIVLACPAYRVPENAALKYVAGYIVANDVSIPHSSYYRPPIRERCRDGFCPMSAELANVPNPDELEVRISINGELRSTSHTSGAVRGVARLIADVTQFLTLRGGDILLMGEDTNAPEAKVGDTVRVEIEGVGSIENTLVGQGQ